MSLRAKWRCVGGPMDGKEHEAEQDGYWCGAPVPKDRSFETVYFQGEPVPVSTETLDPQGSGFSRVIYRAQEFSHPNGKLEYVFVADELSAAEAERRLKQRDRRA